MIPTASPNAAPKRQKTCGRLNLARYDTDMKTIDVSGLPEPFVQTLERMIELYRDGERAVSNPSPRPIGWAKGTIPPLPQSFFEDLPEEFLSHFGPAKL